MPSQSCSASPIGSQDRGVGGRCLTLHPLQKRGSEVERDPLQRVQEPSYPSIGAEKAGRDHRAVALAFDPLIPVVIGASRRLGFHHVEERVLAWWLVKVAVNYEGKGHASCYSVWESTTALRGCGPVHHEELSDVVESENA